MRDVGSEHTLKGREISESISILMSADGVHVIFFEEGDAGEVHKDHRLLMKVGDPILQVQPIACHQMVMDECNNQ
jgi:hypothetical protein